MAENWTVGQSGLALYRREVLVGTMDSREVAEEVAAAMNAIERAYRCGNCDHPIMRTQDGWTHGAIVGWQGRRCVGALTGATLTGERGDG